MVFSSFLSLTDRRTVGVKKRCRTPVSKCSFEFTISVCRVVRVTNGLGLETSTNAISQRCINLRQVSNNPMFYTDAVKLFSFFFSFFLFADCRCIASVLPSKGSRPLSARAGLETRLRSWSELT